MSLRPRLPDECFRYRKRKQISLNGTVAGVQSSRPRGRPVMAELGPWGSAPQEYIPPLSQSYDPPPGFADFPESEYDTYESRMPHSFTPRIRDPGPERLPISDATPGHDDSLMTDAMFVQGLLEMLHPYLSPGPIPAESDVTAQEFMNGSESLDQRMGYPMPPDPIQEIEAAFDQQRQDIAEAFEPPQPDPSPYVLHDDYLQKYEEQVQQMMDQYWMPGPPTQDPIETQQMYDEQMQQLMDPFAMPGMGPGPMM